MTAKQYLSQTRYLDLRINSKLQLLSSLNDLATKCTAVYSDMPKKPNRGGSRLEDTICKIVDLQDEINEEIDKLVDLKSEIADVISEVSNTEYRLILEKRYLNLMQWEDIASDMGYELRWVYRNHNKALAEITVPKVVS